MNLFALTSDASRRIVRFPLSRDVQSDVEAIFTQQEREFHSYIEEEIAFDGKYKPDEGECLKIEDYDDIDNLLHAVKNPLSVPEVRPDRGAFEIIKALFSGYSSNGNDVVLIQSFDKRKILSTRGLSIFHSGNVYKRVDGVGLTLGSRLVMVLQGKTLKIFSFHVAKQILDLSQYYKEATDDDLKELAGDKKISIDNVEEFTSVADNWIRRKVAFVMQSGILDGIDLEATKTKALVFGIDLNVAEVEKKRVIVLPQEKAEIKKVLRFLDEDYYESVILGRPYLSSSKRAV